MLSRTFMSRIDIVRVVVNWGGEICSSNSAEAFPAPGALGIKFLVFFPVLIIVAVDRTRDAGC